MAEYKVKIEDRVGGSRTQTRQLNKNGEYTVGSKAFSSGNRVAGSYLIYDSNTGKYYEDETTNQIPVVVTDAHRSKTPTPDKYGYSSVSQHTFSKPIPIGKALVYDQSDGKYYEYPDATSDWNNKLKTFEAQYAQNKLEFDEYYRMYSNPEDPHQINSTADIVVNFFNKWKEEGFTAAVKDLAGESIAYTKDKYIDPFQDDNVPNSTILFNALNALGEGADLITGAGLVKALILDGENGVHDYFSSTHSEQGRTQYDYNVDTGNAVSDFAVNMFLEVVSDPTTWLSLGSSLAAKAGVKGMSTFVGKTATKIGLDLSDDAVLKISKAAMRAARGGSKASIADDVAQGMTKGLFKNHADEIADIFSKSDDALKRGVNPQAVKAARNKKSATYQYFLKEIKKEAEVLQTSSDYRLLRTVKGLSTVDRVWSQAGLVGSFPATLGATWVTGKILRSTGAVKGLATTLDMFMNRLSKTVLKKDKDVSLYKVLTTLPEINKELSTWIDIDKAVSSGEVSAVFQQVLINQAANTDIQKLQRVMRIKHKNSAKVIEELDKLIGELTKGAYTTYEDFFQYLKTNDEMLKLLTPDALGAYSSIHSFYKLHGANMIAQEYSTAIKKVNAQVRSLTDSLPMVEALRSGVYDLYKTLPDEVFDAGLEGTTIRQWLDDTLISLFTQEDVPAADQWWRTTRGKLMAAEDVDNFDYLEAAFDILDSVVDDGVLSAERLAEYIDTIPELDMTPAQFRLNIINPDEFLTRIVNDLYTIANPVNIEHLTAPLKQINDIATDVLHNKLIEAYRAMRPNALNVEEVVEGVNKAHTKVTNYSSKAEQVVQKLIDGAEGVDVSKIDPADFIVTVPSKVNLDDIVISVDSSLRKALEELKTTLETTVVERKDTKDAAFLIDLWLNEADTNNIHYKTLARITETAREQFKHLEGSPRPIRTAENSKALDTLRRIEKTYDIGLKNTLDKMQKQLQDYDRRINAMELFTSTGEHAVKNKMNLDSLKKERSKLAQEMNALKREQATKATLSHAKIEGAEVLETLEDKLSRTEDAVRLLATDEVSLKALGRAYVVMVSKTSAATALINDPLVRETAMLSAQKTTGFGDVLEVISHSVDEMFAEHAVNLQSHLQTVINHNALVDAINNTDNISDVFKAGILDALANVKPLVDGILTDPLYDTAKANERRTMSRYISEIISHKATDYINGVEGVHGTRRYGMNFNVVDTEDAIGSMRRYVTEHLDDIDELKDSYVIYWSGAPTHANGDLGALSLAGADGKVHTFRRESFLPLYPKDAEKFHGMDYAKYKKQYDAFKKKTEHSAHTGSDEEIFSKLRELVKGFDLEARAEDKKIIWVNANNKVSGNGTDLVLKRTFKFNKFDAASIVTETKVKQDFGAMDVVTNTFDIVEHMNKQLGQFAPTQGELEELLAIINATVSRYSANIRPNENLSILADLNGELLDTIKNLLAMMRTPELHNPEVYRTLRQISAPSVIEFSNRLSSLSESLRATLKPIADVNDVLRTQLIDEKKAAKWLFGRDKTNMMKHLKGLDISSDYTYSLKKVVDLDVDKAWWNKDFYNTHVFNTSNIDTPHYIAGQLEKITSRIRHNVLVASLDEQELKRIVKHLAEKIKGVDGLTSNRHVKLYAHNFELATDNLHLFAQATYFYNAVKDRAATLALGRSAEVEILQNADTYVYGIKAVKPANTPILTNRLASVESALGRAQSVADLAKELASTADDITSYKQINDLALESMGVNSAHSFVMQKGLEVVTESLYNYIGAIEETIAVSRAELNNFLQAGDTDKFRLAKLQRYFTGAVTDVEKKITDVSTAHATASAIIPMTFTPEQFTAHLVKNGKGYMLFRTGDEVFQNMLTARALGGFEDTLKAAHELGVRYEVVDKDIFVYFSLEDSPFESVLDVWGAYKDYKLPNLTDPNIEILHAVLEGSDNILYSHHEKLLREMSEYLDESFAVSSFTKSTPEDFKAVREVFPEHVRNKGFDVDALKNVYAFDDGFNCSIIGDYSTQMSVYSYMSNNMVTNMALGINLVKNKLAYVQDMTNMYYNPKVSLKNTVKELQQLHQGRVAWKDIKTLFKDRDYVINVATVDKRNRIRIKELNPMTQKQFDQLLDMDAVTVMPRYIYDSVKSKIDFKRVSNTEVERNNLQKIYDILVKELRPLYIVGYLSTSPSTWIRNGIDGTLKAAVETGDPKVIKYILGAHKRLDGHALIRNDIIRKFQFVNPETMVKWFDDVDNVRLIKDAGLSLEDFKTMQSILEHPSASLSQATLKHSRDGISALKTYAPKQVAVMIDDAEVLVDVHKEHLLELLEVFKEFNETKLEGRVLRATVGEKLPTTGSWAHFEFREAMLNLFPYYRQVGVGKETLVDKVRKIPLLGKYLDFNMGKFSGAEDVIRMGHAMYYVKELNMPVMEAVNHMLKGQFDYGNKSGVGKAIETFFPFTTFKMYNTMFWAYDAIEQPNTLRALRASVHQADNLKENDINDEVRTSVIRARIAAGQFAFEDADYWERYMNYEGVNPMYATTQGHLKLGWQDDNLYVKAGNSILDAADFMLNPLASMQDSLFAPIESITKLVAAAQEGDDTLAELLMKEDYAASAMIPILGIFYNRFTGAIKNWNAIDFTVGRVFGTLMPSLIAGVDNKYWSDRPIGYDWYNQTDEYKKEHKFVPGISYVPAWVNKNPSTYVDVYGRLMKMGYSEEDINTMLTDGWSWDTYYELRQITYTEENIVSKVVLNDPKMYEDMIKDLITKGWTPEEADYLMKKGVLYEPIPTEDSKGVYAKGSRKTKMKPYKAKKRPHYKFHTTANAYNNIVKSTLRTRPVSHRNPVHFSYRDDLYKQLYTPTGGSRLAMRANYRGYSNAALGRQFRNDLQWKYTRMRIRHR